MSSNWYTLHSFTMDIPCLLRSATWDISDDHTTYFTLDTLATPMDLEKETEQHNFKETPKQAMDLFHKYQYVSFSPLDIRDILFSKSTHFSVFWYCGKELKKQVVFLKIITSFAVHRTGWQTQDLATKGCLFQRKKCYHKPELGSSLSLHSWDSWSITAYGKYYNVK